MTWEYNPAVQRELNEALDYYEAAGGVHLADRFMEDFAGCIAAIAGGPARFPFYQGSPRLRRIRLKNFPFLIVYRESEIGIRVLVLKHERRDPRYGTSRR